MKYARLFLLLTAAMPANASPLTCIATPGLAVDADGAPDSYRVDGLGLSFTCDGAFAIVDGVVHTQKNDKLHWQDLCNQHWTDAKTTGDYSKVKIVGFLTDTAGRPVIQADGDPLPGLAYVTTTTLTIPGTPNRAQRHYVNASEIPYAVLPPAYAKAYALKLGDLVAVYRPKTGHLAYAVYGDCCSLGEASVRLHLDLGSNPIVVRSDGSHRAKLGIADRIEWIALTGTHTTPTLDSESWRAEIKTKGDAAIKGLGGLDAVKACNAG
jgi:hypothetical protein